MSTGSKPGSVPHEDEWVYTTEPIGPNCPFGHPWNVNEYVQRLEAALNCSHNNVPPDDPDNPWAYIEHEGKTWNHCPECGLIELWEGGMFFGAKLL